MSTPTLCLSTLVALLVVAHSAHGHHGHPHPPTAQPGWCSGIKNEGIMASMTTGCSRGNYRPNFANGAMPQASASPYTIQVDSLGGSTYAALKNYSVIIKATSPATAFKGFFIRGDCSEATFAGDLQCTNAQETHFCYTNGSTHLDCTDKFQVDCIWTAPAYSIGKVQFQATIIQDEAATKYWTGVLSDNVLDAAPGMVSYAQNTKNIQQEYLRKFATMQQQAKQMMTQMGTGTGNQGNMNVMQNMARMMNMKQQSTQGTKPAAAPAGNAMVAQMMKMMAGGNNQQAKATQASASPPSLVQQFADMIKKAQTPKPKVQQASTNPQMTAMQKMMNNMFNGNAAAPQQNTAQQNKANQMRAVMNAFGRTRQQAASNNQWHYAGNGDAAEAQESASTAGGNWFLG